MINTVERKTSKPLIFLIITCIFILVAASLWIALKHGIVIDRINLSLIQAERVSVRIDGGIIASIDRLNIPNMQASDSKANPGLLIARFNQWARLILEVRINQINYQDHTYKLLFKDNQLTVSGDNFMFAGNIAYQSGEIQLNISKLELKPYAVILTGKAAYVNKTDNLQFSGRFRVPEISGHLALSYHQNQVNAEIESDQFTDLAGLLARFSLNKTLTSWISENITAGNYQIKNLQLDLTLRDGKPDIQSISISGKAVATDAAIRFNPSLPPIQCRQVNILFENDRLSFELNEPKYKTSTLAGSTVLIDNLLAGRSQMDINVLADTRLDSDILELLKAYNIHLDFSQQEGTIRADLHLVFDLPEFTLHTEAKFTTGNGKWSWGDTSFQIRNAAVQLKDNLITIENSELAYQDMLRASLAGTIDSAAKQAALTTNIAHLNFRTGEKDIFKVQNFSTPIKIQFGETGANIDLLELETGITLSPSRRIITVKDLNKVKPYIPVLQGFPFQDGKLNFNFTDPENLTFDGVINTTALPLTLNDQQVTEFIFKGGKTAEKLTASINGGKITLSVSDNMIIELSEYLVIADVDSYRDNPGPALPFPLSISGTKSLIKTKKVSIPTKDFKAEISGSDITFSADLNQGKLVIVSENGAITLKALDIDALVVQDYFDQADLTGGRFDISVNVKDKRNFAGFVEFSNVLIKNLSLMNNVFAFFNVIPALATLTSPGFDKNGYHINEGAVDFTLKDGILTIHKLRTDGKTIDLEAEGWIDVAKDLLEIKVQLFSLKDYSKIIRKVPLAGYVILGADGSLSTNIDITGNYTAPVVTTHVTKEIMMTPVKIIKRTIKWPFRLFNKTKEPETENMRPQ